MLLKNKDDNQDVVNYLSDLLERDIPDDKKRLIERELKNLHSGNKGEKTSAYYLNFDYSASKNWAIIHDLRLEHDGDVAQIDHLMIGRMLDIYVIESKNFTNGVSISDEGHFSYFYKNRPFSIPSPISQNERHIRLLNRFLSENNLLPKRLGVTLKPIFRNIVLISPQSRLTKPKSGLYDCTAVMKADMFVERLKKDMNEENLMNLAKVISSDSLKDFSEKIILHHKPFKHDYKAKFVLKDVKKVEEVTVEYKVPPTCPVCSKKMIQREATKGKNAGNKFWGCSQYPKCRGVVALDEVINEVEATSQNDPVCPNCKGAMIKRVSKKGKNAGSEFWGCQSFPKCRGVVSIDGIV